MEDNPRFPCFLGQIHGDATPKLLSLTVVLEGVNISTVLASTQSSGTVRENVRVYSAARCARAAHAWVAQRGLTGVDAVLSTSWAPFV